VWCAVLAHHTRLLAIARHGGCDPDQARDVAQEAMLRAATTLDVDVDRVGALLTVIARRLTTDVHRRRASDALLVQQRRLRPGDAPSHEDQVCDHAEARWLQEETRRLPAGERTALSARVAGTTAAATALDMDVSAKAVEAMVRRARLRLRALAVASWALAVLALTPCAAGSHPAAPVHAITRVGARTAGVRTPGTEGTGLF
jgi:RNA polymerase sigma factor (sigma-70 family)